MSTIIAIVVYGAFAVGYVLILALTERSAERYVRNPRAPRLSETPVVLMAARSASVPAAVGAQVCPLSAR